ARRWRARWRNGGFRGTPPPWPEGPRDSLPERWCPRRPSQRKRSEKLLLRGTGVVRRGAGEPVQLRHRLRRKVGALPREPGCLVWFEIARAEASGSRLEAFRDLAQPVGVLPIGDRVTHSSLFSTLLQ